MNYKLPKKFPLLPRKKDTDKINYGHVFVLAGSQNLTGAAILASRAALESGSGLVTLGLPESLGNFMTKASPEIMRLTLPETREGSLNLNAYKKIREFINRRGIRSILIGPGLSAQKETVRLVRKLVANIRTPLILDADGLNSFKGRAVLLKGHGSPFILTPHQREFERLFSEKWPESVTDRVDLAKKLSKFYDVVLVLKGHRSLVVQGDKVYMNTTGNPGMAKGGTGDVLSGMIAAFVAQKLNEFEAAAWAVYFHGLAGDIAVKDKGELGLRASHLIEYLPQAFAKKNRI